MHRNHRGLDREGDEEADEQLLSDGPGEVHLGQVAQQEGTTVDTDADDGEQHHQATGQGVQQELHGGTASSRTSPSGDEEVHRDEGGLEHEVEQQDVGGGETVDRQSLEHEGQAEESSG